MFFIGALDSGSHYSSTKELGIAAWEATWKQLTRIGQHKSGKNADQLELFMFLPKLCAQQL